MVVNDPAAWIEAADGDLASAAKTAGLVDRIGTRTQFGERVAELVGEDEWSDLPGAYPSTNLAAWLEANPWSGNGTEIGVVTIAGNIVDGSAGPGTAGGERIAELLDEALDKEFAGLVVRVDSPGGSVTASEQIRNAILRHKARDIPIAVSMGNVAASGGYWVSTPADRIFAQPETITGSIGIFAIIPTFEGAAQSLGVTSDGVTTGPLSGQPDPIGGFTPEVDRILQATIEDGYRDFLSRVATSRKMDLQQVDRVGQGRVWDGGTARQLRLVDEYGGMPEALAWVAAQADLADGDWSPVYLGDELGTTDTILRQLLIGEQDAKGRDVFAMLAGNHRALADMILADSERLLGAQGAQAYCLACPAPPTANGQSQATPDRVWAKLVMLLTD